MDAHVCGTEPPIVDGQGEGGGDVAGSSLEVFIRALDSFKRSVEITRDVRFQANIRLNRRQRASAYVVSFLSLYVIALSLIPNIIELNHAQSQMLLSCSIVLSVFVIFTSLIDGSQNFFHQGELLHSCARKIATIHHSLKNIDYVADLDAAKKSLSELQSKYQRALDDCPVNHDNVDFYNEMASKPGLFPEYYTWKWNYPLVMWSRSRAFVGSISWVMLPATASIAITWVVYKYVILGAVFLSK